ncbi:MAG: hypothetical protein ACRECR_05825, partial [Thermoplasmata archaeon]
MRLLEAVGEELARSRGESELAEFPRGLVGYVPRGDRGDPPGEDPLANRIELLGRLLPLARLGVADGIRARAELAEAVEALRRGDRESARRRADS